MANLSNNTISLNEVLNTINNLSEKEDVTAETNAYTTELAELTTAVTALEEELAGKAAGGGAIETCTVDLASAYDWELEELWYSNGNEVVNYFPGNVYDRMSLTVVKNTILYMVLGGNVYDVTILGDAEPLTDTVMTRWLSFSINGDCSIDPVIGGGPM